MTQNKRKIPAEIDPENLINPIFHVLKLRKGFGTNDEIFKDLIEYCKFSKEIQDIQHEGKNESQLKYNFRWAKTSLKTCGVITDEKGGTFLLTKEYEHFLDLPPKMVTSMAKNKELLINHLYIPNFKKNYQAIIYFGTPGSGKSQKIKRILEKYPENCIFRTTFHPDTDYASFVGCYKPKTLNDGKAIGYEFVPQIFTNAYCKAWQNPEQKIFLIIEEINRGNCAHIFGDIFQLLDRNKEGYSEYPIKADTDLNDYLSQKEIYKNINDDRISGGELCLPPNLSIIATMNTSDQSLFPMDSAFKRRWDWEYVPSEDNEKNNFKITVSNKDYSWHDFRKRVNEKILATTNSEDKQLGSFFIKDNLNAKEFKSKVMFYLWSEIYKEEVGTNNNIFKYTDEQNQEKYFTFNELFGQNGDKILESFLKDQIGTNFWKEWKEDNKE